MAYTVYCHTSPNGKRYVGITKQSVERRWRADGSGYVGCSVFYYAIQKYGWDNMKHEIICQGLTKEEAELKEQELIKRWNTMVPNGYNLTGGGGVCSFFSEESREKISEAQRGERHHYYGKHRDEETRRKISETLKGVGAGENNPFYGKKHSEETRRRISEAAKERCKNKEYVNALSERLKKHYAENGNMLSKKVVCVNTGITYENMATAAKASGTHQSSISQCCSGKLKSSGKMPDGTKMVWRYG